MIWDALDFFIVRQILENGNREEITTWKIANRFNWSDKKTGLTAEQRLYYYDKKNSLVKARLTNMAKAGIVKIERNSRKKIFSVDASKVLFKKHKFPCGIRNALFILDDSQLWTIYELK